ncbi:hypothetical protein [Streptomyces sp. NPDC058086]|uniref:hypothetical protein n=1 Tax=Streptomyces sp. NPDC058086 TaxID=3346334 RepID=UPI0036F189FC
MPESRREVPLPPHVLEALERHIHRLERDVVVFTTVIKGRANEGKGPAPDYDRRRVHGFTTLRVGLVSTV